ncbi:MAG: hypothetical protein GWP91_17170 [Rhodobacterales bacterium]|nr:hypothetical protein [Rhodobacterales bacterium]
MEHQAFIDRVLQHLPSGQPSGFEHKGWEHAGRPTKEGFGIIAIPGVDPTKVMDAVMDLDNYVGNVDHVTESRTIVDARFEAPKAVRFYQRVDIPLLGAVHHELAIHRMGELQGFQVAAWHVLRPETDALSSRKGFRSDYNVGAWFAKDGVLGYALGSAPKRGDVGFLKWKALTKGADVAASRVLKTNIEGMARWAAKR